MKYYKVSQSIETLGGMENHVTQDVICQTLDLEEAEEVLAKLEKDFFNAYLEARDDGTKEFMGDFPDDKPKSEIHFEEVSFIYDSYGDWWLHSPVLETIEITFFNKLNK